MATVELTKDSFEDIVSKNDIVIVDFWAAWCGPCKSFASAFEAASEKYPDVVFGKVNTEEQQELASYFQIRSIPNIMLFREKVMLFTQPGAMPAAGIDSLIEQTRGLDMAQIHQEIANEQAQQSADAKA